MLLKVFKFLTLICLIGFIITTPHIFAIASTQSQEQSQELYQEPSQELTHKTILILGDSLSAGHGIKQGKNWTDLLQLKFIENNQEIQLINASISGDTVANGLNRLPAALEQFQPDIIIIELGGNDGLRGLPIQHIKDKLTALIRLALDSEAEVILMAIQIPPNYGKKYTQAFGQIYSDLAQQHSIQLMPFILNDIALNDKLMQIDGIHPNEQAQPIILEQLWQILQAMKASSQTPQEAR